MKNIIMIFKNIIMIFIFAFVVLGCKKEEPNPLRIGEWGYAQAEMNGQPWSANSCRGIPATGENFISIFLAAYDGSQPLQQLYLRKVYPRLGKQFFPKNINNNDIIKAVSMSHLVIGDNDLICAEYNNLHDKDSLQNWVDVIEYNPDTKEIKAKFNFNLIINPAGGNAGVRCKPSDPDTIRVRNGFFHTKIR